MNRKTSFCSLGIVAPYTEGAGPSSNRLANGFLRLEQIERRRARGRCSLLDKLAEKRIVWREILELEFQALRGKEADREGLVNADQPDAGGS